MHMVTIAGRVVDEVSNNPIAGATVRVRRRLGPIVRTLTSDVDGEFEFNYNATDGERLVLRIDKDPGYKRTVYTFPTAIANDDDDRDVGNVALEPYVTSAVPSVVLPARVRFLSAYVSDDTDYWGSGEIYFRFTVNERDLVTGRHDISSGATNQFPSEYCIQIPSGAVNVSVQISARDNDKESTESNPFLDPHDYNDLGTKTETWDASMNFGRGTHELAADKFSVTYVIE